VDVLDLAVERLHLRAPTRVQLVPVLEVVTGALLEVLRALGHLVGVRDRVGRDVDVAVHDPVVDAHRGRHRERSVLPAAERVVGMVDLDHVERGHREGEVLGVPEPEPVLVRLAAVLVEQRPVGIHLLPAVAAGRSLDRERTGKVRHLSAFRSHSASSLGTSQII
jgi:hypothetical protein